MEPIEQPKSLVDQTHDILLNAICAGEFAPGMRLNQDALAARLKVSRQPVNSAISVLRANGFVQDTGRRGVVVARMTATQFLSIYEYRSAVEPFAVRLAHARKPVDAADQAAEILSRGRAAVQSGDARQQIAADAAFHEMIYRWADNPAIENSMRMNWQHIRRSMGVVVRDVIAPQTSWDEHTRIIDALLQGDVADAEAEMRGHIERAQGTTVPMLEADRAQA